MASSPGPATPEVTPQRALTTNRSFTTPAKLATPIKPASNPSEGSGADKFETLYIHPNTRIVRFSTKGVGSRTGALAQPAPGTLPWTSSTESTIASGQLEVYIVRGSVPFLRSGEVVHQILPRAQCWCVDGVSKFAFKAREPEAYFRVELPAKTDEELELAERFKVTLKQISFYEKTPCPFARGFSVELPEAPEPRRKKRRTTSEKVKKWKLDNAYGWKPEGWQPGMDEPERSGDAGEESGSASASGSSEDDSDAVGGDQEEVDKLAERVKDMSVEPSMRVRAMEKLRSVSAPHPQPAIAPSTPRPRLRPNTGVDGAAGNADEEEEVESSETRSNASTLRPFQAIPTDMPPSPPDSSAGLEYVEFPAQAANITDGEILEEDQRADRQAETSEILNTADDAPVPESKVDILHGSTIEDIESPLIDTDAPSNVTQDAIKISDIPSTPTFPEVHATTADQEAVDYFDTQVHEQTPAPEVPDDIPQGTLLEQPLEDTHSQDDAQPREDQQEHSPSTRPETPLNQVHFNDAHTEDTGTLVRPEPTTPPARTISSSEDPYAAIQARILARRSLSGTTSFHPLHKSPTRSSTSSTSSTATIISNRSSRTSRNRRPTQDLSTSLVGRAYSAFLGPPAHILAAMLKIAARFAGGAFGVDSMFYVESPANSPRRVPGSYADLRVGHVEEVDVDGEGWEDDEDDFGVPLNRPASNLTGLRERGVSANEGSGSGGDVD